MGNKNSTYANFLARTQSINFRDTGKVIEKFNSCVRLYKRFQTVVKAGDDDAAGRKLLEASTALYMCVEWSLKNYLDRRYVELEKSGIISKPDRINKVDNLTSNRMRLKNLINEFEKVAEPKYDSIGIDTNLIFDNAKRVNNKPKHDANTPDAIKNKAVIEELRKIISNYISPNAVLELVDDSLFGENQAWYDITEETQDFSDCFSYILVINKHSNINYNGLFSLKWDLIIDFDNESEIHGSEAFYRSISGEEAWKRMLNNVDVNAPLTYSHVPYWVYANGLYDDPSSTVTIKEWKNKKGKFLNKLLENFHKNYTQKAKVFMVPVGDPKATERIAESFADVYDEDACLYMLSSDTEFNNIELDTFRVLDLTMPDFADNLLAFYSGRMRKAFGRIYEMPAAGDKTVQIEESFYSVLCDSFDVAYINCAEDDENDVNKTNRQLFYNGDTEISWYGIKEQFDVKRNDCAKITKEINVNMEEHGRLLLKVCHEPGMGGSTLLKRLAWEFRTIYPTLILRRINEQTAKNVQKIYDLTHQSILIFADCNNISCEEVTDFQTELKKFGFAFIIVFFERKPRGIKPRGAVIESISSLNEIEMKDMKKKLDPFIEEEKVKNRLIELSRSADKEERSPFIMSMYVFDERFKGLKPFIGRFLDNISDINRKILFSLALADYGNVPLDIEFFTDMCELDSYNAFITERTTGIQELIRVENVTGKKYVRIKHHLFAVEILKQLSGGPDAEQIVFGALLDDILKFIEDSRKNKYVINQDTLRVLRSLFFTRSADEDSERPAFSDLISKLKEEMGAISHSSYDGSNDAIITIFNKLVEVYPEEPHFTAHLARYYFYIEKNYEKGFQYINKAIELSKSIVGENVDPLLYHMKAMGYASRIGNEYIPSILKHDLGHDAMILLLGDIENDAKEAFKLFQKVRERNVGVAGHISEIHLCIKIANMAKNLLEESEDFGKSIMSPNGKWALEYIDRAIELWDDCQKMLTERERESYSRIDYDLKQLDSNLEQSISLWEEYLSKALGKDRILVRRMLARTYEKQNQFASKDMQQQNLHRIVELMQDNINEDNSQPGNIRIWFDAIMKIETDDEDWLITDALKKLNDWVYLTDSVEAHYYRFMLKFIQALRGSELAERDLPNLLREMKSKSLNMYNRTIPQHWLMDVDKGLLGLSSNTRSKSKVIPESEMASKFKPVHGRISTNYVNDAHAYIYCRGVEVFFNPTSTKGEISRANINQRVGFGIGFSFDGPRAYNSSIKLLEAETPYDLPSLECGMVVKCEVIKNVEYYTKIRIVGYNEFGSIHVDEYISPFSSSERPRIGMVLDIKLLSKVFDNKTNQEIWQATMVINSGDGQNDKGDTEMAKALKKLSLNGDHFQDN